MNRPMLFDVKSKLGAEVGKALQGDAFLKQIQAYFDLYSIRIAVDISASAKNLRQDPQKLLNEIEKAALTVFSERLYEAVGIIRGSPTGRPFEELLGRSLTEYFNLQPDKVAHAIRGRAKELGISPDDAASYLREVISPVIKWVFAEAREILAGPKQ